MAFAALPRGRRLLAVLLVAATPFLAWRIVVLGMAEHAARERDDPAAALAWHPAHADAHLQLGLAALADNPEAARRHLQAAIAADPSDGRAYAALGRLLEQRGNAAAARQAMETAARLAPQRSDVQQEVTAYWLRQGRLDLALTHLDSVLRHRPDLHATLFPGLLQLAGDPAHQAAFSDLLKQPRPWWPAFFRHAADKAPSADAARLLFAAQQGTPNAADPDMLRAYLARLQKDGAWLEAWFAWMNSLSKGEIGRLGYLYNGSFETPPSNLGFDWIVQKHPAVAVDTASTYDTSGERALRVSFRGLRAQYRHLHQYLLLPPGDYLLQGRVRPDNLQAAQGMQWVLSCAGRDAPLATTERFKGSAPWQRFRTAFSVPADCPVQQLRLELAGSIRLDFDASGSIWFDNLVVEQVGAAGREP
jgi:tetratricopeptide (TPR) repeat protein